MGFAIAGMHYTGMAAVQFSPRQPYHEYAAFWEVTGDQLHWPVILGSILVLGLTLLTAVADTQFQIADKRAVEAEHALRASEERFRAIVETSHGWIWETTADGVLTYSNPASATLLGVPPEELLGKPHLQHVYADDQLQAQAAWRAGVNGRAGWNSLVLRWQARDGTIRYLEGNATTILDDGGALIGFRGADRDITERKHAEVMKSDFVSFVSHQLRTPLSGVSWMLELAAESPGLTQEVSGYIGEARDSAHRLIRLVNDLLDVSRLESGRLVVNPEHLRLDDVVGCVVSELQPLAEEKELRLRFEPQAATPMVYVDGQLIRQAVTNLLSNAIKYTPNGGRIDVTVSMGNGSVACAIRDNGIGVPKEAQSRLFEKFYRADNAVVVESEGTGLGLHLVRLVVEHFGGKVWCESERGQGALFTMELPVASAPVGV
jgi:PAS domain S-box-containing protein